MDLIHGRVFLDQLLQHLLGDQELAWGVPREISARLEPVDSLGVYTRSGSSQFENLLPVPRLIFFASLHALFSNFVVPEVDLPTAGAYPQTTCRIGVYTAADGQPHRLAVSIRSDNTVRLGRASDSGYRGTDRARRLGGS